MLRYVAFAFLEVAEQGFPVFGKSRSEGCPRIREKPLEIGRAMPVFSLEQALSDAGKRLLL